MVIVEKKYQLVDFTSLAYFWLIFEKFSWKNHL